MNAGVVTQVQALGIAELSLGLGDVVEVPAGRVERGEELAAAARRECQEEIGVTPERLVPIFDLLP